MIVNRTINKALFQLVVDFKQTWKTQEIQGTNHAVKSLHLNKWFNTVFRSVLKGLLSTNGCKQSHKKTRLNNRLGRYLTVLPPNFTKFLLPLQVLSYSVRLRRTPRLMLLTRFTQALSSPFIK